MDDNSTSDEVLLSFEGRIDRANFWFALYVGITACLVRLVFLIFVVFALNAIFGTSVKSVHLNISDIFNVPPGFPLQVSFGDGAAAWLVSLLFYVGVTSIFASAIRIPAATAVKRLHDRDKSGWWIVPFVIAPILLGVLANWLDDSWLADLFILVMIALGLWGFVEILCLGGTSGPNRFGLDPQAPAPRRPRPAPNWHRLRELEFVRRGAGPSAGEHVKRGHD
jgi:uncharacterized membrane protein YhaH (DUF805 family)